MFTTQQDRIMGEIDQLVEQHGRKRGALIPILQGVRKRQRTISDFAMQTVADRLGIHPVEVYGVVTFFAFLDENCRGRFVIRLCRTLSCDMAGKDSVARQLQNDLGVGFGQTTPDGRFTLDWANCIGMCDQGPALLVNEMVFTNMTPEKVHDVLSACEKAFGPHTQHAEER